MRKKMLITFCIIPFLFLGVVNLLPHLYTPPALTEQKLNVYNKFIDFMSKHREVGNLGLTSFFIVKVNGIRFDMDATELEEHFSPRDIGELKKLSQALKKVGCASVAFEDSVALFYPERSKILPQPAGVLYAFDREDPNRANGKFASKSKPFRNIKGLWYVFKNHALSSDFSQSNISVPQSLIDQSLVAPDNLLLHSSTMLWRRAC